jgi:tRNA threonylcarbamoyl adenosine modification protein YeaZ
MELTLGIDASCPRSVVCVGRLDEPSPRAGDATVDGANQASRTLMPRIQGALDEAGVAASALQVVGCGVGPGTFTGTRVAIATAKGLALGLGARVQAVSTLCAIAFSTGEGDGPVLAIGDARRGEVYAAAIAPGRDPQEDEWLLEPRCATWREIVATLPVGLESLRVVGPGVAALGGEAPPGATTVPGPSVSGLWRSLRSGLALSTGPSQLKANYLRKTYAELGINKPKRPVFRNPLLDET